MAETGRPTLYTPELFEYICDKISQGIPLSEICREDGMPSRQTVYNWIEENEDLSLRFARARDFGFDEIAEDCLRIADTPMEGEEVTTDNEGKITTKTGDMLGHRKLMIETRLKLLSKWSKRYGDKVQNEYSGSLNLTNSPITFE